MSVCLFVSPTLESYNIDFIVFRSIIQDHQYQQKLLNDNRKGEGKNPDEDMMSHRSHADIESTLPSKNKQYSCSRENIGPKPWVNVGESMHREENVEYIFGKKPESDGSGNNAAGLRPWLNDAYAEETKGENSKQEKEPRKSKLSSNNHDHRTSSSQSIVNDGFDMHQEVDPQHFKQGEMSNQGTNSRLGELNNENNVARLDSRPPSANRTKQKERRTGGRKPQNYEPKLYVANKTLSLRRSGSLSKLADPSLAEQMGSGDLSNRFNSGRSSSNSRLGSR